MRKPRILVVDDSAVMRRLLREAIAADASLELQGTAANGMQALAQIGSEMPDLVVLDLEMPEMDGLATLVAIRKMSWRLPVIIFSSLTEKGAAATIDSLTRGASDYVTKPTQTGGVTMAVASIETQLLPKIRALCSPLLESPPLSVPPSRVTLPPAARPLRQAVKIVAIGSSTGGPNALATVITQLPKTFPVPIVIVQHMPPLFTRYFAERLHTSSHLEVREVSGGEVLRPGGVWIAPGDHHMVVRRRGGEVEVGLHQEAAENSCRPSVDVLFRSVASLYEGSALAVVLTGMGQDGFLGAGDLVRRGSRVIVQDEASSVVWGMPGIIARSGLADRVLPLERIAHEIQAMVLPRGQVAVPEAAQRVTL